MASSCSFARSLAFVLARVLLFHLIAERLPHEALALGKTYECGASFIEAPAFL
jgi:hypothetical protein